MARVIKFMCGSRRTIPFRRDARRAIPMRLGMSVYRAGGTPVPLGDIGNTVVGTLDPYALPDRREGLST